MVITVCGKADSRALVYPLIYTLKAIGTVMVASDDGAYRRLYHGYDDDGEVSGVTVYVNSLVDYENVMEIAARTGVANVVCVTNGYVPDGTEYVVMVRGQDLSMQAGNIQRKGDEYAEAELAELDIVSVDMNMPVMEVLLTYLPVKHKYLKTLTLKDSVLKYVYDCENYKRFVPIGKELGILYVKMFSELLVSQYNDNAAQAQRAVGRLFGVSK